MRFTKAIDLLMLAGATAISYVSLSMAADAPDMNLATVINFLVFAILPVTTFLLFRYRYRSQLSGEKWAENEKRGIATMVAGYVVMICFLEFCPRLVCGFVAEFGYVIAAVASLVLIVQMIAL